MAMLGLSTKKSTWKPPAVDVYEIADGVPSDLKNETGEFCYIFRTDPYVDLLYVKYDILGRMSRIKRFVFHEGYYWSGRQERQFHKLCVNNPRCMS